MATGRDMGRASVAAFVAGSTYSIFGFMFLFFMFYANIKIL